MNPVRGRADRLLEAVLFLFLFIFVAFAVLLLAADVSYIDRKAVAAVLAADYVREALWRSLWTSCTTTAVAVLFAIPMGYVLSRYRFPGHVLVDTLVDLPIVFPPLVAGLTLLIFFHQTALGRLIEAPISEGGLGLKFSFQPAGIVLCQFVLSASFAIRSAKTAFDDVDRRLEDVALTLGCSHWGSFRRVSLPLARGGILAGGIMTWARSFGIFGPLMIFVGTFRGRTEVLSTTIYLEQSVGNLETALAVAILMIGVAVVCLVTIRLVGGRPWGRP